MSLLHQQLPSTSRSYVPFQPAGRGCNSLTTKGGVVSSGKSSEATHVEPGLDRRTIMVLTSSLVTSYMQCAAFASPASASADATSPSASNASGRGLARYIRKKQLDPLETYVPLVLEARSQLEEAGTLMDKDPATARNLLRSGAFGGLRENIRALGEYATTIDASVDASALVNDFFKSLEQYDRLLYVTAKDKAELDADDATAKLQATTQALDKLLATVPDDVMAKSKAFLSAAVAKSRAAAQGAATPSEDDRVLRSLLN